MKNNSLDINKKIIALKDYINKNEDLCIPSVLLESLNEDYPYPINKKYYANIFNQLWEDYLNTLSKKYDCGTNTLLGKTF